MLTNMEGAGAESSDSTLAAGRAALDGATQDILTRTSGRGYTLAGCHPARSRYDMSLAKPETPLSLQTLRSSVCLINKAF